MGKTEQEPPDTLREALVRTLVFDDPNKGEPEQLTPRKRPTLAESLTPERLRTQYILAQVRVGPIVDSICNPRTCQGGRLRVTLEDLGVDSKVLYKDLIEMEQSGPHLGIDPRYNLAVLYVYASKIAASAGEQSGTDDVKKNYYALAARYQKMLEAYGQNFQAEQVGYRRGKEAFRVEELRTHYMAAGTRIRDIVGGIYNQKVCSISPRRVNFKDLGIDPKILYQDFRTMECLGPHLGIDPWYSLATLYVYASEIGKTEEVKYTPDPVEENYTSLANRYLETLNLRDHNPS